MCCRSCCPSFFGSCCSILGCNSLKTQTGLVFWLLPLKGGLKLKDTFLARQPDKQKLNQVQRQVGGEGRDQVFAFDE
jgi:hypothetical protein